MKISIENIKNDNYKVAERWFKVIQKIYLISFALNILFLFLIFCYLNKINNYWVIYIFFAVSLLFYLFIFICDNYYERYRKIAEELRIIQFNKANLHIDITPEKKSYLLSSILSRKDTLENEEIDYEANYFENQNLKFSLLQNIFLTQKNFKHHSDFYLIILFVLSILLVIFFLLFSLFSNGSFLNLNEDRSLIFQVILYFFNLITTTRYYIIYQSFKNKSDALKELDAELVNTNSSNRNKIISLLIEYNTLLVDSHQTFSYIYNKHSSVLNYAWNQRITSYSKEKLLADFKVNIEQDIKELLSHSKRWTYKEYQIIGSYLDESFVNGKSDLDILLIMNPTSDSDSDSDSDIPPQEFYNEIFKLLQIKFGDNIKKSVPSFIMQNFSDLTIEFTPCFDIGNDRFKIVDSNYKFQEISPKKYSEYFKLANDNSSGLFNSLIKEIMRWKYGENYALSSIYLKIYLSNFIKNKKSENNFQNFLKELVNNELKDIENPIETNKKILPCEECSKQEIIIKIKSLIKNIDYGK